MSLLIEALKQAEARKAKLAAEQARAGDASRDAASTGATPPVAGNVADATALELEPMEVPEAEPEAEDAAASVEGEASPTAGDVIATPVGQGVADGAPATPVADAPANADATPRVATDEPRHASAQSAQFVALKTAAAPRMPADDAQASLTAVRSGAAPVAAAEPVAPARVDDARAASNADPRAMPAGERTAAPPTAAPSAAVAAAPAPAVADPPSRTQAQRQAQSVFAANARPARRSSSRMWIAGVAGIGLIAVLAGAWSVHSVSRPTPIATPQASAAPTQPAIATPPDDPVAAPSGEVAAASPADAARPPADAPVERVGEPTRDSTSARSAPVAAPPHAHRSPSTPHPPARPRRGAPAAAPSYDAPQFHRGVASGDTLQRAWAALRADRLDEAAALYRQALRQAPRHPDAVLGLAAIAERQGDVAAATQGYREVLRLEPGQPVAAAALAELAAAADPQAAESQIRNALADRPDTAPLQFALGNRLAADGRWSEAQQAYFQAFALDPANADYAFNVAVALDRLHKAAPATQHYRRALELANAGADHAFDTASAARRLRQLDGRAP